MMMKSIVGHRSVPALFTVASKKRPIGIFRHNFSSIINREMLIEEISKVCNKTEEPHNTTECYSKSRLRRLPRISDIHFLVLAQYKQCVLVFLVLDLTLSLSLSKRFVF